MRERPLLLPAKPGPAPSSSDEMANRGISMIAEQQRRRTVSGGLESLSVGDDSLTDRRFLKLEEEEEGHEGGGSKKRSNIRPDWTCWLRLLLIGRSQRTHISGEPMSQQRSLDLRLPTPPTPSPPSSLRLRLVGGGVLLSSCRDSRSILLYTCRATGKSANQREARQTAGKHWTNQRQGGYSMPPPDTNRKWEEPEEQLVNWGQEASVLPLPLFVYGRSLRN